MEVNKRKGRWESESESDKSGSEIGEERRRREARSTKKMKSKESQRQVVSQASLEVESQGREERIQDQAMDKDFNSEDQQLQQKNHKRISYNPLVEGCRSIEVYHRLNFIDQGTYGLVFRAKCTKTDEIVAIKQIKLGINENRAGFPITALREINILLSLKHPNIVDVKEMVVGSSLDKMYMVMEYLENDLKSCMQSSASPFSIAEIKTLMLQLLSGVNHMHQRWFIHRDLKTSNLLYSNKGKLVICDFGMARKYGSPLQPYTFEVVTLWYRSPEVLLGQTIYSTALDMWSVGCIFGELILRKPLFPGQGESDQLIKIFKILGAPTEDRWPGVSALPNTSKLNFSRLPSRNKLRETFPGTAFGGGVQLSDKGFDLLSRLLCLNPEQRMSAAEALQHDFFQEIPLPCSEDTMPRFPSRHEEEE